MLVILKKDEAVGKRMQQAGTKRVQDYARPSG